MGRWASDHCRQASGTWKTSEKFVFMLVQHELKTDQDPGTKLDRTVYPRLQPRL